METELLKLWQKQRGKKQLIGLSLFGCLSCKDDYSDLAAAARMTTSLGRMEELTFESNGFFPFFVSFSFFLFASLSLKKTPTNNHPALIMNPGVKCSGT